MNQNVCHHHEMPYSIMLMSADKVELLCEECYITLQEQEKRIQIQDIVYLKKALNSATYLLSKTKIRDEIPNVVKWLEKNDENEIKKQQSLFEKQIFNLQASLDAILKEFKDQINLFATSKQNIAEQLKQVNIIVIQTIKFTQFQELIQQLGEQQNQDIIKQIEIQLFQYCNSINKEQIKQLIQNFAKQNNQFITPQRLELFNNQVKELNQNISSLCPISTCQWWSFDQSKLLSEQYKTKLIDLIEEKSKKQIQNVNLIFLGSRDSLNAYSFWSKVNGKSNLFFVFQSRNNNSIFGGYSPCLWSNLCKHSYDDTMTSFLFSQTNNEIYPLRQDKKHQSIWGQSGYGPIFGCNDMHISADFTQGHSDLGNAYKWDKYNNSKSSHLFGGLQPNIIECEIFEII